MIVTLDNGSTIALGTTETAATIAITDYSRRVTDDFGVTTVVRRGFSRRMSLRFALPFEEAGRVQSRLAELRATPALWVADDRWRALSVRGLLKEFEIDLAVPPQSYCSLSVDGLAESDVRPDPGGDPAPAGMVSALKMVRPMAITDGLLTGSSVAEDDAPTWASTTTYADGAKVRVAHRVFESLAGGNVGNDPTGSVGKWIDIGPTNRWSMFDQALGSATTAAAPIVVSLATGTANTIALLDVAGATVRVQGQGYDRTLVVGTTTMLFSELPGGSVTVTIAGGGTVSVGTLLVGHTVALGVTEASPTAGITDYSRKEVDDFGEVTIVQRAWSKRMQASARIRSDAVDTVFDRIAGVRAIPTLWIGDAGNDALTIYGFFKEASIEIAEGISKLSLSIEGLSQAAKIVPLKSGVDWPDVGDPDGTKPANGADVTGENTSKDTKAVGGRPATDLLGTVELNGLNILGQTLRGDGLKTLLDAVSYIDSKPIAVVMGEIKDAQANAERTFAQNFAFMGGRNGTNTGWVLNGDSLDITATGATAMSLSAMVFKVNDNDIAITRLTDVFVDSTGATLRSIDLMDLNGNVTGKVNTLTGEVSEYKIYANVFKIINPNGGKPFTPFQIAEDGTVEMISVRVKTLAYEALIPLFGGANNKLDPTSGFQILPGGFIIQWGRIRQDIGTELQFSVPFPMAFPNSVMAVNATPYINAFSISYDLWVQNVGNPSRFGATLCTQAATRNEKNLDGIDWIAFGY